MISKKLQNRRFWHVGFNIIEYIKIDDIISIITLIDNEIIGKCEIYETNIFIEIYKSNKPQYDYICKTNINCESNFIENYLSFKFIQVQNLIKNNNREFGSNWKINFKLI